MGFWIYYGCSACWLRCFCMLLRSVHLVFCFTLSFFFVSPIANPNKKILRFGKSWMNISGWWIWKGTGCIQKIWPEQFLHSCIFLPWDPKPGPPCTSFLHVGCNFIPLIRLLQCGICSPGIKLTKHFFSCICFVGFLLGLKNIQLLSYSYTWRYEHRKRAMEKQAGCTEIVDIVNTCPRAANNRIRCLLKLILILGSTLCMLILKHCFWDVLWLWPPYPKRRKCTRSWQSRKRMGWSCDLSQGCNLCLCFHVLFYSLFVFHSTTTHTATTPLLYINIHHRKSGVEPLEILKSEEESRLKKNLSCLKKNALPIDFFIFCYTLHTPWQSLQDFARQQRAMQEAYAQQARISCGGLFQRAQWGAASSPSIFSSFEKVQARTSKEFWLLPAFQLPQDFVCSSSMLPLLKVAGLAADRQASFVECYKEDQGGKHR